MEELGRLDALAEQLSQSYPGASLEDIDLDELEAALGEQARVDARALAELERELRRQGLFERMPGRLAAAVAEGAAAAGRVGAARRRRPARRPPRGAGDPPLRGGRRADRRDPAVGVRRHRGLARAADPDQRRAAPRRRRPPPARRHRRRDRRDRAAQPGGGGAVRRHVVVDGPGRALGADEAHGTGAAPADLHPVPRRRPGADHLRPARPLRRAGRADRPGGRLRAGHEPAPRAAARGQAPAAAPRRPAGGAGGDRRRTDRAPASPTGTPRSTTRPARTRSPRRWGRWTG